MRVSSCIYLDWELEGLKKTSGRDFLSKNLLGSGYRKQKIFFGLIVKGNQNVFTYCMVLKGLCFKGK